MSAPHHDGPIVVPGGLSLQGPHRVEAFALCPQLEAFAHEMHLRSIFPKEPTCVGVLWHAGLAYHYGLRMNPRPDWLVYRDGAEMIERLGAKDPRPYVETALNMLDVYQRAYAVDQFTPILVEHQFVVTFANGEPYSCRTDLLAYVDYGTPGQHIAVVDHKGVGKMGNEGAKYHIDRQMATNIALARANGFDVRRVIINAQSRKPPYTPMRFEVPINAYNYNRLGEDTKYYLDQMKAVRQSHPDPRNRPRNTGACVWGQPVEHEEPFRRKFGACDYFGLCHQGATMAEFDVPAELVGGKR